MRSSLSSTVKLMETTSKACLINEVIDLILHACKGQFDSLITSFCVLSWSWS